MKRHGAMRAVAGWILAAVLAAGGARAQAPEAPAAGDAGLEGAYADVVTINVQDGELVQVLNAFSRQTGRSIVIGPNVSAKVNVRLSAIPWQAALDVILKPYGYGYQLVGDAIVVNTLDSFKTTESVEPLLSRVFQLKYLDAAGVKDVIEAQLSPRGKWSALTVRGQRGWEYEEKNRQRSRSGAAGSLERRQREADGGGAELEALRLRSKTIIVVDTPQVIEKVAAMLAEVDRMPIQVLIEARFVEVRQDFLQDLGVEFGTGPNGATVEGVQAVAMAEGGGLYGLGVRQTGGGVEPANFKPETTDLSGTRPYQAGLSLLFQQLTDFQFEVLLHMLEEDAGANVLSSPRVLTLNDQEATIMVGTKYPIIQSNTEGSGTSSTVSTSLEYYEDIGITLNVVPQICDGDYVRMVVNPKVRTLVTTTSGVTGLEDNKVALTEYPVLSTRETETQIMLKSGQTIVIGGLLEDQQTTTELRVPILGSLPLIGRLFRRETTNNNKVDLLIFLTATIVSPEHGASPEQLAAARLDRQPLASPAPARAAGGSEQAVRESAARAEDDRLAEEAREAAERRAAEQRLTIERAAVAPPPAPVEMLALPDAGETDPQQESVMKRFPSVPTR